MIKSSGSSPLPFLLALYLVSVAGLTAGFWYVGGRQLSHHRKNPRMVISLVVLSIPTAIGVSIATAILISLVELPFHRFPALLEHLIGWPSLFLGSALTAMVLARKRLSKDTSRGTVLLGDVAPGSFTSTGRIRRARSDGDDQLPSLNSCRLAGAPDRRDETLQDDRHDRHRQKHRDSKS